MSLTPDTIKCLRASGEVEMIVLRDGMEVASVPEGRVLQSVKKFMDEFALAPDRPRGTTIVHTAESFAYWMIRHRSHNSVIFSDLTQGILYGIVDYHAASNPDTGRDVQAGFGEFRVRFSFPLSREWSVWTKFSVGGYHSQEELAEFLEDNLVDVVCDDLDTKAASPSALMKLATDLSINVTSSVKEARKLSSGETTLVYDEQHSDAQGAPVKIPSGFSIAIPVFNGGPLVQVACRLRYRVVKPAVKWRVDILQAERLLEEQEIEASVRAAEATDLPLFFGSPA